MPFANGCSHEFGYRVRERGEEYFHEGRVSRLSRGKDRVTASVLGSSTVYQVVLDWGDARRSVVAATCTCPYFDDRGPCKHIWATMLAADDRGIGPHTGAREMQVLEEDPDEREPDDNWTDEDEPCSSDRVRGRFGGPSSRRQAPRRKGVPASSGSRKRGKANWQSRLADVFQGQGDGASDASAPPVLGKTREAVYVLDVTATASRDSLAIGLFRRETKLNGEFGVLRSASVSENEIDRFTHPEDRQLLELLLASDEGDDDSYDSDRHGYGYYGYRPKVSEVSLSAAAYERVLPKLCATGRFLWLLDGRQQDPRQDGRVLAWDDGPPYRFRLVVSADDERQQWRLEGQLVRDGQAAPVPLAAPVLLLAGGAVLLDDRLARFDVGDSWPWIAALRKTPAIEVPHKDRWELLGRLWQLPSRPQMELPANLRCEEVHLPPQGRLIVHPPEKYSPDRLFGDVEFQYGDKKVAARDGAAGIVDAESLRILVRDRPRERELIALLPKHGARSAADSFSREHDVWVPRQQFSDMADALVEAGWIVEAEGYRIRKAGQWRLSVTSGIDWFDLDGTCDFEGIAVKLPELLAALRRGENYVRLGDGSRGLLPREWLARFAPLANMGQTEGDAIRFCSSQALLLDALLAAQPQAAVDERFAHVRNKLRSFEGIAARDEPPGFTGKLRQYQKEGLGWLDFLRDFHLGGCLADDMGLGKTVQVLALLQARRADSNGSDGRRAPSLVVVPRSLVFNWIEEARRFAPDLRVLDYTGSQRQGVLEQLDQYDLLVTTYGTLHRDIAKLKDIGFDYAILDEGQAIKNAQSQRAKACRLLQADHRLALSGTPVENHLGELWSLFEFLNPGMLGGSTAFQELSKSATGDGVDLALLRRALAPFILRRTKEQVLRELPEKTEQTLHCELAGRQRTKYNELRDYYRASLSKQIEQTGLAKSKIHVLEALLRLRQAACHLGLLDKQLADQPSAKLDALLEQLAEVIDEGHKALVFSQFTSFLALVRRRLDAEKIVYEYLDGRTRDRRQRVDRFQNDADCRLFLISLKAGGHGLNLTAADYVFILDPWWNPAVEAQAVDRAHRIGQSRRVFAYRLIARDTVEEKIVELQKTKRDLAEAIVSADGNILRNLTADDLQVLLS